MMPVLFLIGDLEVTIMRTFSTSAQQRSLASSDMLPPEIAIMG